MRCCSLQSLSVMLGKAGSPNDAHTLAGSSQPRPNQQHTAARYGAPFTHTRASILHCTAKEHLGNQTGRYEAGGTQALPNPLWRKDGDNRNGPPTQNAKTRQEEQQEGFVSSVRLPAPWTTAEKEDLRLLEGDPRSESSRPH